ncbi:MAG: MarR family transcriptional regulator [Gammaproteobacteria bacterium]|nr:MarR family transcriptional regulator [Gammaproteobacteria bacterium]
MQEQEPNLYELVLESLPEDAHHRIAWLSLVRCFSSIERVLMRHFGQEYNSSLPRYDVLTALALDRSGLTMGDLAATLMVTKGNITGVVRRLEQEKLVLKNTSSKDRRVQSVKISAKGVRLWEKMHADYDRMISALMAGQTESQIQALVTTLRRTRKLVVKNARDLES